MSAHEGEELQNVDVHSDMNYQNIYPPQPQSEEPPSESKSEADSEEGPQSSVENIIPLKKLKHGWMAISGFMTEKATEVYNSESVQHIKQRTTEIVTPAIEKTAEVVKPAWERTTDAVKPAWEKTVEVATPIWEQTKATSMVIAEKTRENVNMATERVKPAVRNVSEQVSHGWESFSTAATAAASTAAERTASEVNKLASRFGEHHDGQFEHPPSAMDAASQGKPMNV